MNRPSRIEALRKRAVSRLTTPPEVLYAFTRHSLMIALFLGAGLLIMVAKVATDPVVYEGRATLQLSAGESVMPDLDQDQRTSTRDEVQRFFSSRVVLLSSDGVLRKLVQVLKVPNVMLQEDNPDEFQYGPIRKQVTKWKKLMASALEYLEHPRIQDFGEEDEIQKAIDSFRRRSMVVPDPRTNTAAIHVFGSNRDLLAKELEEWIDSYINRLVEMTKESRDLFFNSCMVYWKELEEEAHKAMANFKNENPEVSRLTQELLQKELTRLQGRLEELIRHSQHGIDMGFPVEGSGQPQNPEAQLIQAQIRTLMAEMSSARSRFSENSDVMRVYRETLQNLKSLLSGIHPEPASGAGGEDAIKKDVEKFKLAYSEAVARQSSLDLRMDKLQNLEEELRSIRQMRRTYELMSRQQMDRNELNKAVQVQISDKPFISWKPYNSYPHLQVLYGSVAAMGLGMILALLLEVFSGKLRYKNDVVQEFGLPVVGVIPKR